MRKYSGKDALRCGSTVTRIVSSKGYAVVQVSFTGTPCPATAETLHGP